MVILSIIFRYGKWSFLNYNFKDEVELEEKQLNLFNDFLKKLKGLPNFYQEEDLGSHSILEEFEANLIFYDEKNGKN